MKDQRVDLFGLAEPNVDWHWDLEVMEMRASARKVLQHVHTIATTSSTSYETIHKPGGVLSGVIRNWIGRILTSGEDPRGMGRWTEFRLAGKNNKKLTVIMAYRVCSKASGGRKTVFTQQYFLLREQCDSEKILPQQKILEDLGALIDSRVAEGDEVIHGIDANETLEEDGPWQDFITRCDLYDLLGKNTDPTTIPPTHEEGRRINFLVGTRSVFDTVVASPMDGFKSGVNTDHWLIFVDLNTKALLGRFNQDLDLYESKKLHSTRPQRVKKYKEHLWTIFQSHKIQERTQALYIFRNNPPSEYQLQLNALD